MKFRLQLVCELSEDGSATIEDIFSFDKGYNSFEDIGISLAESKEALKTIQQVVVEKQLQSYIDSSGFKDCKKKGYYPFKLKTLFGDVSFRSPRFYGLDGKTFSPLNALLPQHSTPELLYLETKWASLVPFEKTAGLLKEVLPIAESINGTTIQNHLYSLAESMESRLGKEDWMYDCGSISEREELLRPDRTMVVGIDGGYVRDWTDKKTFFEAIAGKSVPAEKRAKCFGFVNTYDTRPKQRLYEHLRSQGMQPHQKMEFFSDGADNMRDLQFYLNAESTHILDWFHISMRATVLKQYALGLAKVDAGAGATVQKLLESAKWDIWHGKAEIAAGKINDMAWELEVHAGEDGPKTKYGKLAAFQRNVDDFYTYINNNAGMIVDYAERYQYGETITTSFVESTVNYVVDKRFAKKQSMQWTKRGAHLMLQVRTHVLNDEWEGIFRQQYPNFRRPKIGTNEKLNTAA